jgi:ATP-dependent DNA helicase RecG
MAYAMKKHVQPLIDAGVIRMTLPERPKSSKQMYISTERQTEH